MGAAIYVSLIDDVTGVAGTAVQIGNAQVAAGANLLPGAAVRYSQADIEAVLTVPSTKRPRLRFTAATNGLEAQTLMLSNGVYTNLNGQDSN